MKNSKGLIGCGTASYDSWHPTHQKAAFILAELKRYILRESSREGYLSIQNRFYLRLRAKGYPLSFLLRIFSSMFLEDSDAVHSEDVQVGFIELVEAYITTPKQAANECGHVCLLDRIDVPILHDA